VFASPSLQIGFAAMTLRAAPFDTPAQTAETVLAHHLSTGALWEDIRMKGGAYGASASSDSLERCFTLSTYRDPAPLRSLDSFSAILKSGPLDGYRSIEEDELVKTIIGCYARETRPRSPAEKGITDFLRYLSRIEDDYRRRRLQRLIAASAGDIAAALGELASQEATGCVIITGMKGAEQAAKALGTEVQTLPV
jgi:Zn-dependent M16 (insulinase) family peptidase